MKKIQGEWTTVIKPKNRLLDFNLKELWHYKDLILLFVKRDFVSKYKQTILGPAWALIQPLLTTVVFTVVFGNIAGLAPAGVPSFLFFLAGSISWGYFSGCLTGTAGTFTGNAGVFGKVYFPRLVSPIATVISNLISFAIQFIMFIVALIIYCLIDGKVYPNVYVLMFPVVLFQMALLGLGVGVIFSALTTKYRDLSMLIGFLVNLWMYATPVAYGLDTALESFSGGWQVVYMLNPVTSLVELFKYGFLGQGAGSFDVMYYGISWAITISCLFIGVLLFNKVEKTFIDTV